ncbi:MAG: hypothetical protein MZV70_76265 [Desulfobacterales bacterium]|nr:hypothetical protein [Desulfobacterales bacterium]
MTKRLSPLMVDDLGIVPAIQWLCRSLSPGEFRASASGTRHPGSRERHPRLVESRHLPCAGEHRCRPAVARRPREPHQNFPPARRRTRSG